MGGMLELGEAPTNTSMHNNVDDDNKWLEGKGEVYSTHTYLYIHVY